MRTLLVTSSVFALALAGTAHATTYHYSGAACQPEQASDAALAWTNGAGIGNKDTAPFGNPINVVCPLVGMESSTQTETELKARLWDGNGGALGIGGFWQIDSVGLGTAYWSSIKYACAAANGCSSPTSFTGGGYVRWTGGELFAPPITNFSTYSFRAMIPGRCYDTSCYAMSWVQAYWASHVER